MSPRIHSAGHISLDYSKTALGRIRERLVRLFSSWGSLLRHRGP